MRPGRLTRSTVLGILAAALAVCSSVVLPAGADTGSGGLTFAAPQYIDTSIGGGEPTIFYDPVHKLYIYTAHEGTTHTLVADGVTAPLADATFATNYRNQVNIWTSPDATTWTRTSLDGTGFTSNPANNTGFSDPDITQDEGGRIYNTGIDLVNDALYSSPDGGKTWDIGTPQCHDGDRPWLAAGPPNTVWLGNEPETGGGGHTVWESTDAGASCGSTGIKDSGAYGKLLYDDIKGSPDYGDLVEPVPDVGGGNIGVSVLPNAVAAFQNPTAPTSKFTQYPAAHTDGEQTNFPVIAFDAVGNLYESWADAPSGGENTVWLTESKDGGVTWSAPLAVAHPGTTVFWPWIVAGSAGNVGVTWYQYDQAVPGALSNATGNMTVWAADVIGMGGTTAPTVYSVDASGRPVHQGGICTSGTTCEVSGVDRRLGDYFTNYLDPDGCQIIATGDTMMPDAVTGQARPWSLPLFLHQSSGPSLTGGTCGAGPVLAETPWAAGLPVAAFLGIAAVRSSRCQIGRAHV